MQRTLAPDFEIELKSLLEEINLKYDYDFRQYSSSMLKRRVIQAMVKMNCDSLSELKEIVLADWDHFYDLVEFLTVSTTEMFRDPEFFLGIREKVVPFLETYPSLKIWVAGCSTGEEIYSLAILLHEEQLLERTILYATDINPRSLEKAATGIFDLKSIQNCSQNYLNSGGKHELTDYYTTTLKSAKFNAHLIKNITFSDHSLVTDSVFSETQLILCRNVLIYFDRELQNRTIGLFHESLCRKGFLGLGSKETIQFSRYSEKFDPFVKKDRIFKKK